MRSEYPTINNHRAAYAPRLYQPGQPGIYHAGLHSPTPGIQRKEQAAARSFNLRKWFNNRTPLELFVGTILAATSLRYGGSRLFTPLVMPKPEPRSFFSAGRVIVPSLGIGGVSTIAYFRSHIPWLRDLHLPANPNKGTPPSGTNPLNHPLNQGAGETGKTTPAVLPSSNRTVNPLFPASGHSGIYSGSAVSSPPIIIPRLKPLSGTERVSILEQGSENDCYIISALYDLPLKQLRNLITQTQTGFKVSPPGRPPIDISYPDLQRLGTIPNPEHIDVNIIAAAHKLHRGEAANDAAIRNRGQELSHGDILREQRSTGFASEVLGWLFPGRDTINYTCPSHASVVTPAGEATASHQILIGDQSFEGKDATERVGVLLKTMKDNPNYAKLMAGRPGHFWMVDMEKSNPYQNQIVLKNPLDLDNKHQSTKANYTVEALLSEFSLDGVIWPHGPSPKYGIA